MQNDNLLIKLITECRNNVNIDLIPSDNSIMLYNQLLQTNRHIPIGSYILRPYCNKYMYIYIRIYMCAGI